MIKQINLIIIATTNKDRFCKVKTIINQIAPKLVVKSLFDFPDMDVVLEVGQTERQNAILKAKHHWQKFKQNILSMDVGIYIDGFKKGDQPGIYVHRIRKKGQNVEQKIIFDYWYELIEKHPGIKGQIKRVIVVCSEGKIFTRIMSTRLKFLLPKVKPQKINENPLNYFMVPDGFADSLSEMKNKFRVEYEEPISYNIKCLLKEAHIL